jgi:signal transduction histidine kinase
VLMLSLFAAGCLAGGYLHFRTGLHPIRQLRARLAAVHEGKDRHVEGTHPAEVQPLVDDLNALLDQREQTVKRAQAKAGDLAHGLKTPLAVLASDADRAAALGQDDLATSIRQQVDRMRRQMDYHLAQARAAASGATSGARCVVAESAEGLSRALRRLYAERGIELHVKVPTDQAVRVQRQDLDEMLGNLLDNACKWASSQVTVASAAQGDAIVITVDDDGQGLDTSMREAVLQRGVRADEAAPGSGIGLAIVRDLTELYGGTIALEPSAAGGVRARLELPRG